uniref:Pigment dispersing hormone receptor 43673 n=1 Tax=Carcinus maenas TaxID=6759 RepID=A0A7G7MT97_CARMA|nr:pigment dispersing hormone receptor 43673 [Carcinus maenas]
MTYSIFDQACVDSFHHVNLSSHERWCNATWDMVLCWPPTPAGESAHLSCPPVKGVDPSKTVYKRCDISGRWAGKTQGDFTIPQGWTNYTVCFTKAIQEIIRELYKDSAEDAQTKLNIALGTRIMEIIGLSLSLASLCISLAIFFYFRSLKNNRTRIHRNLFVAMVIQVMIRLVLYIDQAIIRGHIVGNSATNSNTTRQGIDNTPVLCEASYVLLEYARTAMFMWMFIEGLYLHNKITVTVFQHRFYYSAYHAVGWGVPVLMTAAWATATAMHYGNARCWWGYNFTSYFWILEGPRFSVISLNMVFLLNIIRVLVTKLRQSNSSEALQVRKAVKAAIVLLPLLGITNVLNMIVAPLGRSAAEFGLWSYATHFLTSFQGFFIALLYCFLNGEVRTAVRKYVDNYLLHRSAGVRRGSGLSSVFLTTVTDLPRDHHGRGRHLCSCLRGSQSPTHSRPYL